MSNSKKKASTPFTAIGISSLLVVFIVICLVTFACLSLSTARSNYNFAEKNAGHKQAYYNAYNEAEENILAVKSGKSTETKWQIKINENQALLVEVDESGNIITWKIVTTTDRDYDQTLNLINLD